jgi:hypothetical protein
MCTFRRAEYRILSTSKMKLIAIALVLFTAAVAAAPAAEPAVEPAHAMLNERQEFCTSCSKGYKVCCSLTACYPYSC